jgi:hypothetical protein
VRRVRCSFHGQSLHIFRTRAEEGLGREQMGVLTVHRLLVEVDLV